MDTHHCKVCHYQWFGRVPRKPVECPNCKRRDWDKLNELKPKEK